MSGLVLWLVASTFVAFPELIQEFRSASMAQQIGTGLLYWIGVGAALRLALALQSLRHGS